MKETFERLYKENIIAFIKSYNKEPNEEDLEAIRQITYIEVALKTGHCDDMGWFFLNTKEYNYFKSQCREIEIELNIKG